MTWQNVGGPGGGPAQRIFPGNNSTVYGTVGLFSSPLSSAAHSAAQSAHAHPTVPIPR